MAETLSCGEKISALRKQKGITQSDLGVALNVSFQAVSKWERGESYPDFDTMSKIAKYFNVPLSYFENGESVEMASAETTVEQSAGEEQPREMPKLLGVCKDCGRALYEGESVKTPVSVPRYETEKSSYRNMRGQSETRTTKKVVEDPVGDALICFSCNEKRKRARADFLSAVQREEEAKKRARQEGIESDKRHGFVLGCMALAIVIGIGLIVSFQSESVWRGILLTIVCAFFAFTAFTQLPWEGFVADCFECGLHIVPPGVIFDLSVEGILDLIFVKILFGLIKLIVFVITWSACAAFGTLISPFTFFPALIRVKNGDLQ